MERLFKLTPSHDRMKVLLADGLNSAQSVARMGRAAFVKKYSGKLGGKRAAKTLYARASYQMAMALALFGKYGEPFSSTAVTPQSVGKLVYTQTGVLDSKKVEELKEAIPNWTTLFGSPVLCECEHCRSVYSPAAYFVDIIWAFLKNVPAALDTLYKRRPDIPHIELSCENINTPLPYVDLVNEILENAVSPVSTTFTAGAGLENDLDNGIIPAALTQQFSANGISLSGHALVSADDKGNHWTLTDRGWSYKIQKGVNQLRISTVPQTRGTQAELSVNPEYIRQGAYDLLAQRIYPFDLPFNLWVEETRTYLQHLGVRRYELMETFHKGESPSELTDISIASESLLLTTKEREIITGALQNQPWEFWGLMQTGNAIADPLNPANTIQVGWVEALGHVDILLARAGLSYKELREAIRTSFLDQAQTLHIEAHPSVPEEEKDTCDPTRLILVPLNEPTLTRVYRFLRLWRKLGWTIEELDKALAALNPAGLDVNCLVKLSLVQRLRSELKIPLVRMLTWWSEIDSVQHPEGTKSLYEQLFLNKAILNPIDDAFRLEKLATNNGKLSEHVPAVVAALGISASDLSLLVSNDAVHATLNLPQSDIQDDALNLANLSRLYRVASFAKALKLSIRDFLVARTLIEIDPFDPGHIEDTLRFVDKVNKIRSSGFALAEVDYLLRHWVVAPSGLGLTEERIALALEDMRAGLHEIIDDTTVAPDMTGELTAKRLVQLRWEPAHIAQVVATLNGTRTFEASLNALPGGIVFPDDIARKIQYDATATQLRFLGPMTVSEETALIGLSNDAAYQAAVHQLFQAPRTFVVQRMQAFEWPTFSAALDPLPASLVFPNELKNRVFYDAAAKELRFAGVMPATERATLLTLSSDAAYQAAVTTLFQAPVAFVPEASNAFLNAADASQLFDPSDADAEGRFGIVLAKLLSYLRASLSEGLVKQKLGEELKLEAKTVAEFSALWHERLLAVAFSESNPNVPITSDAFPDQFDTLTLLNKIALVLSKLKVGAEQVKWLLNYGPAAGWLDVHVLPLAAVSSASGQFTGWERLVDLFRLRDQLPAGGATLSATFALAHDAAATESTLFQKLVERTGWKNEDLVFLAGPQGFGFSFPDSYRNERGLRRLRACFAILRKSGMSAEQCLQWCKPDVTGDDARSVQQAVKSKYENDEWLAMAKPLRDVLREKQRAALVSNLVAHPDPAKGQLWRDVNGLYAHFLMDVEMSPCMMTSRIKQANSSLQLFVQRCLFNLEEGVAVSLELSRQWQWMKNYRVWEANRKVFLYPENWIEPELRDDQYKSPFFQDMETQLLQNELTSDVAEDAFLNYLEKLNDVARLDIAGHFHELEYAEEALTESGQPKAGAKPVVDIHHVFGRTRGLPYTYYHRQWVDRLRWTPWRKVDADVEGSHLIPMVANRRLHVFWPMFAEKVKEVKIPKNNEAGAEPVKYWQIQVAWSEYKNGKWSAKKSSEPIQDLRLDVAKYEKGKFSFTGTMIKDTVVIMVRHEKIGHDKPWLLFVMGCDGSIKTFWGHISAQYKFKTLPETHASFMKYVENDGGLGYPLELLDKSEDPVPVLEETPGTFAVVPLHQFQIYRSEDPLFFEDDRRTFFVTPHDVSVPPSVVVKPGWIGPDSIDQFNHYFVEVQPPDPIGPVSDPDDPLVAEPSFAVESFHQAAMEFRAAGLMMGVRAHVDLSVALSAPMALEGASALDGVSGNLALETLGKADYLMPVFRTERRFLFETFYHPYVCELLRQLRRDGMDGLLQRPNQLLSGGFFESDYKPTDLVIKGDPVKKDLYPRNDVDFRFGGSYSLYNWEVFFHAPLLIAARLSKNQRFEDAQRWFHYIFDPTDRSTYDVPDRFWKTRPFFENSNATKTIDYLLKLLAASVKDSTLKNDPDVKNLILQIEEWRKHPFNPHLIAEMRVTAYQKTVVMKYLDNLIAWGDQLFRRDTIETINEATQLYILAAQILGSRPEKVPPRGKAAVKTYHELEPDLDAFSNALDEIEPFTPAPPDEITPADVPTTLPQFPTLYFCIPKNDKLLGYWDTVNDRLFKIRHCMNIEGVVRQLPLFEPPIDPALLVKAFAMGVDLASALNDMNAPLPSYRFSVMAQKATELCNDVKGLGAALLSALEKKDAEDIALLRSTHELKVLAAVREIKKRQIEEAGRNLEGLNKSKVVIEARRDYYRDIVKVNDNEQLQLDKLDAAFSKQNIAQGLELAVAGVALIPEIDLGASGWAATPVTKARFGGINLSKAAESAARILNFLAAMDNQDATMASIKGGYDRRWEEWKQQEKLAARELDQIDKQIAAAAVRLAIAEQELTNHDLQVSNAKEADDYMQNKFTNRELYAWMVSQIAAVYFQSYQLAYDVAKRAERGYRFELGLTDSNFIQFGYWDSLRKGLLSGEKLAYDLKRMEAAYLEQNRREYEMTKHVSLAMLDPMALVKLKETGECFVNLPEAIFDMDLPGHYMRRIKSVSVTIPCVTGPYTGVNCVLTLLENSIRREARLLEGDYHRHENDPRFADNVIAIQSIVTSSGRNDPGLFELNYRDERYLPFEGAGVISQWRIELAKDQDLRQFDYNTISDVIVHLSYTAREGGGILKSQAVQELRTTLEESTLQLADNRAGLFRMFSAKHELSGEWHRFLHPEGPPGNQTLSLPLTVNRFPFQFRRHTIHVTGVALFLLIKDPSIYAKDDSPYAEAIPLKVLLTPPGDTTALPVELARNPAFGGLPHGFLDLAQQPKGPGAWKLEATEADISQIAEELREDARLNADVLENLILVCRYAVENAV